MQAPNTGIMAVTRLPEEKEIEDQRNRVILHIDLNDLYKHTCAIMITIVRLQYIM